MTDRLPEDEDLGPDNARVFLSYSRKDRERAQSIADVLRERHFGVYKDTDDILPTEEWKGRLEQLIAEADTIVFLLSPNSVASEVCAWEVEYATELNKRIAPIVIDDVDSGDIPPLLARLNFIFATERDRFEDAVDSLVSALNSDIDWIREHTRLAGLAKRWRDNGSTPRLLLRGQDIADAEHWRDTKPREAPAILTLHADFIGASRAAATRRQRLVAGLSLVGLAFALGLAAFALVQREAAVENEQQAIANEATARENEKQANEARIQADEARKASELARQRAVDARNAAQVSQSRMLAGNSRRALDANLPLDAALLALEGLPDKRSIEPFRRDRPLVDELLLALSHAVPDVRERAILVTGKGLFRFSISPDGNYLAAASRDVGLVLVNLQTGRELRRIVDDTLKGGPRPPFITGDSRTVVLPGSDGHAWLVPTGPDMPVEKLNFAGEALQYVVMTPKGTVIARTNFKHVYSQGRDGSNPMKVVKATDIALSPDGTRLGAIMNGNVGILDAETRRILGQPGRQFKGPFKTADQLTYSPDGKLLAAFSEHVVWLVDGETGKFLVKTGERKQSVMRARFDPSSRYLHVPGADGATLVFDLEGKKLLARHDGQQHWVMDSAISDDGKTTVTGNGGGVVQIRDTATGNMIGQLLGHEDMVLQVHLLNDGKQLVTSSEDGTIRLWDLPSAEAQKESLVSGFADTPIYSADGQTVAFSEAGVFDVLTGRQLAEGQRRGKPWHFIKFVDDGRLLAWPLNPSTGDRSDVCLLTIEDPDHVRCMFNRDTGVMRDPDIDPAGRTIAAINVFDKKSSVVVFDATSGEQVGFLPFRPFDQVGGEFSDPAVTPDGTQILLVRNQHELAVYDRSLGKETQRIVSTLAFPTVHVFPDRSRVLFVSDNDSSAEIYRIATGVKDISFQIDRPIRAEVFFSPSGKYLLTRNKRGLLEVRDSTSGKILMVPEISGEGYMSRPVFSVDERFLLLSREANTVAVDIQKGSMIAEYRLDFGDAYPSVIAKGFALEDNKLAVWSWDGPKIWPYVRDPDQFIASAQNEATRCLTTEQRRTNFLSLEPPRWCITGPGREQEADPASWRPMWPYRSDNWRDWLISRDQGGDTPIPAE